MPFVVGPVRLWCQLMHIWHSAVAVISHNIELKRTYGLWVKRGPCDHNVNNPIKPHEHNTVNHISNPCSEFRSAQVQTHNMRQPGAEASKHGVVTTQVLGTTLLERLNPRHMNDDTAKTPHNSSFDAIWYGVSTKIDKKYLYFFSIDPVTHLRQES